MKFLQYNINNSKGAQDLLTHHMLELGVGLCAVSEPAFIPDTIQWFGSRDKRSAILWNPDFMASCRKEFIEFISLSLPHLLTCTSFRVTSLLIWMWMNLAFLENLSVAIRLINGSFIICGDFNAKSSLWGSATNNDRGYCLED